LMPAVDNCSGLLLLIGLSTVFAAVNPGERLLAVRLFGHFSKMPRGASSWLG